MKNTSVESLTVTSLGKRLLTFTGTLVIAFMATSLPLAWAQGICHDFDLLEAYSDASGSYTCNCTVTLIGWDLSEDSTPCQDHTTNYPAVKECNETVTTAHACLPGITQPITQTDYECTCKCSGLSASIGGVTFCLGSAEARCKRGATNNTGSTRPDATIIPCPQQI